VNRKVGARGQGRRRTPKETFLTPGVELHGTQVIEVPKLVLIDAETGTRVRHRVRSMKQALKQQEWYEANLGRRVRIEKMFKR
jgi:hypothetical protein